MRSNEGRKVSTGIEKGGTHSCEQATGVVPGDALNGILVAGQTENRRAFLFGVPDFDLHAKVSQSVT